MALNYAQLGEDGIKSVIFVIQRGREGLLTQKN